MFKSSPIRGILSGAVSLALGIFLASRDSESAQDDVKTAAAAKKPRSTDAYRERVAPLLNRYCIECHSQEDPEAGISLDRYTDQDAAVKDRGKTWLRVRDAVEGHLMPPADSRQP